MIIWSLSGWYAINSFLGGVQDCMPSLFVMFRSFWMVFWEHKTELVYFLSITEYTGVIVNSIEDDG